MDRGPGRDPLRLELPPGESEPTRDPGLERARPGPVPGTSGLDQAVGPGSRREQALIKYPLDRASTALNSAVGGGPDFPRLLVQLSALVADRPPPDRPPSPRAGQSGRRTAAWLTRRVVPAARAGLRGRPGCRSRPRLRPHGSGLRPEPPPRRRAGSRPVRDPPRK